MSTYPSNLWHDMTCVCCRDACYSLIADLLPTLGRTCSWRVGDTRIRQSLAFGALLRCSCILCCPFKIFQNDSKLQALMDWLLTPLLFCHKILQFCDIFLYRSSRFCQREKAYGKDGWHRVNGYLGIETLSNNSRKVEEVWLCHQVIWCGFKGSGEENYAQQLSSLCFLGSQPIKLGVLK